MKIASAVLSALALMLGGCNYLDGSSGTSYVQDTIARLPSGDEIAAQSTVTFHHSAAQATEPTVIWLRLSPTQTGVSGNGPHFLPAKVLAIKGDLREWSSQPGNNPRQAEIRTSTDGDRAWLVHQGHTVASFDYFEAVAVLGTDGQPAWATGAQ